MSTTDLQKEWDEEKKNEGESKVVVAEVNASGHADKLHRQYGLLSICATALTIGI